MSKSRERLLGILLSLCAVFSAGCEDAETGPSGSGGTGASTTSTSGSGGEAGQGGNGGSGGVAGQGGTGGQGGASPVAESPPTAEWVSSGGVAKSEKFKMVFTMGQPSMSVEGSKSSSYRIQGGLVGANGSDQ